MILRDNVFFQKKYLSELRGLCFFMDINLYTSLRIQSKSIHEIKF